jgi:peptide/nickel transport system substrate-binding protein
VIQVGFELDLPAEAEPVSRRRLTRRRTAMLAAAAVVAAGAGLLAGLHGGGSALALDANAVASLNSSGSVVTQTLLPSGGLPASITSGNRSIWVTNAGPAVAMRIDPATGAVVGTTQPVGTAPSGIAVGGGGVWVADSAGATVRWISLSALTTTPTPIHVGQGPGPIAFGDGAAWVVNTIDGTLQRLQGPDKAPSPAIPIGAEPTAVAVAYGSVWVTDAATHSVVRLDAGTREVTDRVTVGNGPAAIAAGAGAIWVANAVDGTVTRVGPSNDATQTVAVGGRPAGVTFAGGSVWVAIDDPNQTARIDSSSLSVSTSPLASPPQGIAAIDDRPWITSVAAPASHRGGTLRILFGSSGGNSPFGAGYHPFDPGAAPYGLHFSLLRITNDGLLALRRIGGAGGLQLVPDLAVAMPAISDGGRTLTFRLRRGIHYSNGDLVKPSDFLFAVRRQYGNPPVSYGTDFLTDIVGAGACTDKPSTCSAALAAGIVPDDRANTLTIHLVQPDSSVPYELATTFADLLPPRSPPIDSGKPVPSTGPYMFARARATSVTLVRNPRFHQWSADAQPDGFPTMIQWTFQPDDGKALTAIERGQADVMLNPPPANRLAELRTRYAVLAHPYAGESTVYLGLNSHVPPFSSLAARQALNLAIDRGGFGTLGSGLTQTPTCQVLPPGMFGYSPYCPYTKDVNPKSGAWRAPDMRRAEALMAQSGTRGDRVQLWSCGCLGISQPEAAFVAGQLTKLGFRVTNDRTTDYNRIARAVMNTRAPIVNIEGWVADFPYPSDFFDPLLECTSTVIERSTRFCDRHLDDLVARAKHTAGATSLNLWREADREAVDQAAWVPLTNQGGIDVVGAHVGNYQHHQQLGILLDQLWVRATAAATSKTPQP